MYVLHLVTRNLGNENLKSLPQSVSSIFQQCSCTIPALPGPITRLCGGLCFGLFLGNLGRGLYGFARCGDTFAVDAKPTIIEPWDFCQGYYCHVFWTVIDSSITSSTHYLVLWDPWPPWPFGPWIIKPHHQPRFGDGLWYNYVLVYGW